MGVRKEGSDEDLASNGKETCTECMLRSTGVLQKGMTMPNWKYIRCMFVALFSSGFSLCFLFPFLPDLVLSMGYSEEEKGYYCGLVASSVFAGRAVGSYFWGWLSDIKGRRLVLLVTIGLNGFFSFCFGFSVNLPLAMIFRFLAGLSNGTVGTVKTVLYEISDNTNQAIGMSSITLAWGLSLILGPTLGGLMASPAKKYPNLFDENGFFAEYEFLPPSALTGFVCLLSFLYIFFAYEESLNNKDLQLDVRESKVSLVVSEIQKPATNSPRKRCDSNISSAFSLPMENLQFAPAPEFLSSQLDPDNDEIHSVHGEKIYSSEITVNDRSTNDERTKLLDYVHRDVCVKECDKNVPSCLEIKKPNIVLIENDYLGKVDELKNVDETQPFVIECTSADVRLNDVTLDDDHDHDIADDQTKTEELQNMLPFVIESMGTGLTLNDENIHGDTDIQTNTNNCIHVNETDVDNYKDVNGTPSASERICKVSLTNRNNHNDDNPRKSDVFRPESVQLTEVRTAPSYDITAKEEKSKLTWIQHICRTKLVTLWSNSDVRGSVMMYAIFSFGVIAFDDVFTVWLSTKPRLDGIGFSSGQIGMAVGVVAGPLTIVHLMVYPAVVAKLGIKWTYVIAGFFIMVPVQLLPMLHLVYDNKVLLWTMIMVLLIPERAACNFCFACSSLLINNSVTPEYAGSVNGIAMTLTAITRTLAPSVGGSVYAWSITYGNDLGVPFDVSFCFVLIGLVFGVSIIQGIFLPSHLNKQKK